MIVYGRKRGACQGFNLMSFPSNSVRKRHWGYKKEKNMLIKILGTESLGVRGLACSVQLKSRKIVIDPGIALGWSRHGFLPHPFQVSIGVGIRETILEELDTASDIIISHFHGDHCPLLHANPYQLGIHQVKDRLGHCRIWARGNDNASPVQQKRREELAAMLPNDMQNAEGTKSGPLEFSLPVPHGQKNKNNRVMMTRIEEGGIRFVHASDIQLLDAETIETIAAWKPDIVLASGPALYHYTSSSFQMLREDAWNNALTLSKHLDTLILDHHLLRSEEGGAWLEKLKQAARSRVCCAADFMKRKPLFLEAWRTELYEWLPVPEGWHEAYEQGKAGVQPYHVKGWKTLISKGKIIPCKWYFCCPMRRYTEQGKLERYWIEQYCLVSNRQCIRYQMEEKGRWHPDNMLPDGEIREDLF